MNTRSNKHTQKSSVTDENSSRLSPLPALDTVSASASASASALASSSKSSIPTTHICTDVSSSTLMDEMEKRLIGKISSMLDTKLELVKNNIIAVLEAKVATLNAKYDEISKRVGEFDSRLKTLESVQHDLGSCLDYQRVQRLNDVIITGIPQVHNEKPIEIYRCIARCLNITPSPYIHAFRIRSKQSKREGGSIIIKLSCPSERDALFNALRSYVRDKRQLTLHDLNCGFTTKSRINIYESLLPQDDLIRKRANHLRRESKIITSVLTKHGHVFVSYGKAEQLMKITSLSQLETLITSLQQSDGNQNNNDDDT